ncbi:hypothetical protein DFH11DRAFT_1542699 [Phellopilus nigrolimitatus]|nr:hypothetical protein DFH11DRAFT_1542699 [Phellopilus nigrolimitatus]
MSSEPEARAHRRPSSTLRNESHMRTMKIAMTPPSLSKTIFRPSHFREYSDGTPVVDISTQEDIAATNFRKDNIALVNARGISVSMGISRIVLLAQYVMDKFCITFRTSNHGTTSAVDHAVRYTAQALFERISAVFIITLGGGIDKISTLLTVTWMGRSVELSWEAAARCFCSSANKVWCRTGALFLCYWDRYEWGRGISRLVLGSGVIALSVMYTGVRIRIDVNFQKFENAKVYALAADSQLMQIYFIALLVEQLIELARYFAASFH